MHSVVCGLEIPAKSGSLLLADIHQISKLLQHVLSGSLVGDVFLQIEVRMGKFKVLLIDQILLKLQRGNRQTERQLVRSPKFVRCCFVETHVRFQGSGLLW